MPSEHDKRPRSYSDPTGSRAPAPPGARPLVEQLPVRSASSGGAANVGVVTTTPRTATPDPADRERLLRLVGAPPVESPVDPAAAIESPIAGVAPATSETVVEHGEHGEHELVERRAATAEGPAIAAHGGHASRFTEDFGDASSTTSSAASSEAAQPGMWERRAEYYKASSYLAAAIGTLVSFVGWILLRRVPLLQPVGQGLASVLKNSLGAMDDNAKGNQPKAIGQSISAVGQGTAVAGAIAMSKRPDQLPLTGIRAAGSGANGAGMLITGYGEAIAGNPAKAISNFIGGAMNLGGVISSAVEAADSLKKVVVAFNGINNFNNSSTPIGGAIDDARKSKVARPWLKDPKVVGQIVADFGFVLNGIALTLNKFYLTTDKEAKDAGNPDANESQQFATLIVALGAVGMFLSTVGYGISMISELPQKPAGQDTEMGVIAQEPDPGNPPGEDDAPPSGAAPAAT